MVFVAFPIKIWIQYYVCAFCLIPLVSLSYLFLLTERNSLWFIVIVIILILSFFSSHFKFFFQEILLFELHDKSKERSIFQIMQQRKPCSPIKQRVNEINQDNIHGLIICVWKAALYEILFNSTTNRSTAVFILRTKNNDRSGLVVQSTNDFW